MLKLAECIAASGGGPGSQVMQDELRRRVREALTLLPDKDREIIVLRFLEQLSTKDAADVLGISLTAAKSRQLRAIARLQEILGDAIVGEIAVTPRSNTALTIECDDPRLADLVDAITEKLQAGQPIDLAAYAAEYPEYAERLQNWIAALKAIVDLGESFSPAGSRVMGVADPAQYRTNRSVRHPRRLPHRPRDRPRRHGRRLRSGADFAQAPRRAEGAAVRRRARRQASHAVQERSPGGRQPGPSAHRVGVLRRLRPRRALLRDAVRRGAEPGGSRGASQ